MRTRSIVFLFALALAVAPTGCRFFTDWDGGADADSAIDITNGAEYDLYVTAMMEDVLAVAMIASEMRRDQMDGTVLHPTDSMELPFNKIGGAFGPGGKVVFLIYAAPRDSDVFRLARMLHTSYDALARDAFELVIAPEDLTYDHLFGDAYWILSSERDGSHDSHAPVIVDGTLEVWVSFSGCSEGTFTLSHHVKNDDAELILFHDYPDVEVDCERMNHKKLTFALPDDVLSRPGIILLNPNPGTDPWVDAFRLKP